MKFISTIIALVMGFSSIAAMAVNPLNPPQMGGTSVWLAKRLCAWSIRHLNHLNVNLL